MDNYPKIIPVTPSYLEQCYLYILELISTVLFKHAFMVYAYRYSCMLVFFYLFKM